MSDKKVALAVIAGNDAIEQGLVAMLDSVAHEVDGIFISFNGNSPAAFAEIDKAVGMFDVEEAAVVGMEWTDDFSAARNHSFWMVEHAATDFDWILWLDTDDIWDPNGIGLGAVIEQAEERKLHGVFLDYYYHFDPERGVVLAKHLKERLFRAGARFKWVYPLHENCRGPMSTRMGTVEGQAVIHERGDEKPKRERNRRIIKRWFEERGDVESRAVMYMAHETFAMAEELPPEMSEDKTVLFKTALKLYQQFTRMEPVGDDTYACNLMVSDALRKLGRLDDSINVDMQGVKMEPERPAAYVSIAVTHIMGGGYEDAVSWAKLALSRGGGQRHTHAVEPLESEYKPFMILGDAYLHLGDPEEAEAWFEEAYKIFPDEHTMGRLKEAARAVKEKRRNESLPTCPDVRKAMWGSWEKRSIAFFQPGSIEPWNPDVLAESGLGGTETCIIKLAQEFARNEWRVAIFGEPGDWEGEFDKDGIEWYHSSAFHPDEPFTVFVGLRSPAIFEASLAAKHKIMWLHDVSMGPARFDEWGNDLFRDIEDIVCVSEFQASHTLRCYGEGPGQHNFASPVVIPNAFDKEMWKPTGIVERDPAKMIYASSPDRGLPRLLELWPEIAKRVPGASLHIFYGWEAIDKIIASGHPNGPRLALFKERVEAQITRLINTDHEILWYGRRPQHELAAHMQTAGVMPYPANFMETFGLVFAQALTAGMIPVVPALGSLPQIMGNRNSQFVVPGSPDSFEYGPRFVDAVVAATQVSDDERMIADRDIPGLSWAQAYECWEQLITQKVDIMEAVA